MIGERLKMVRKSTGTTQQELADLLGLDKSTISSYENDKTEPNDKLKIIIAQYFCVSLDYLTGVIDEKVCYYDSKKFLKYPADISTEEEMLINEFINFIYCRRNQTPKNMNIT